MRVKWFLIILFFLAISVNAEVVQPVEQAQQPSLTTPQNVSFSTCTKMFEGIDKEKLFYLTLGAINENRFSINEIQTYNGYIIFTAAKNKYLATIASIDNKNSILKITPCNSNYFFQPGIVVNIFKYIDINKNTEFK